MKARAEQIAIQTIQTKIQLLRENADVYVAIHGQQKYNKMLVGLINRMTRTGEENEREMNTPVSVDLSQSQRLEEEEQTGLDEEN
jgi:hypothetical protein